MKRITVILLFISLLTQGQSIEQFGFIEKSIQSKNDTISYYIFGNTETIKSKRPLLLFLQGSGADPIFKIDENGSISSSLILPPQMIENNFHYVVIGKPGCQFVDTYDAKPSEKYHQTMSHNYRVNTANTVINQLIKEDFIDKSKVVIVGHSEGGQIAPQIAYTNKNVTHIACLSGTAVNQMYDFLTNIRKDVKNGDITTQEADKQIDSLYYYYKDIMNHPKATDKFWAGHTYLRWSSAIENQPLKYLKQLDIPIYIVAGTNDNAAPIEDMDNIPIEFIALQKENLTYKDYWNYDHSYNEVIINDDGSYSATNHIVDVMIDLLKWVYGN